MLLHHRVTSKALYSLVLIYTPRLVVRGNVKVRCLAQKHDTATQARARTQTTRSEVQCANH